jgi:hypothetical protein
MFDNIQVINDDKLNADLARILKGIESPFKESGMNLGEPLYGVFLEEET